ncbi:MAG: glycoside hydrolase family 26 protein [Streptosporangiaceae bacterium]
MPGEGRVYLGAYTNFAGVHGDEAAMERRERALGRGYDLQLTYYNWSDPFPDYGERDIVAHRRMPQMCWYGPRIGVEGRSIEHVLNGSYDDWIARQAARMRHFGYPILLRLMIEMNGNWYHGYSGDPTSFVAAWRRVWRIFHSHRVENVAFVWCPNIDSHPNTPENAPEAYYPGDRFVDWIGVDGYNTTSHGGHWRSFADIFGDFLRFHAGDKPLMIGETAADETGDKATYIRDMHAWIRANADALDLRALCWFDTNTHGRGHRDWRVNSSPGAWAAWRDLAADPLFGGSGRLAPSNLVRLVALRAGGRPKRETFSGAPAGGLLLDQP